MSHREARGGGNYKTNCRKSLFRNGVRIPRAPKSALNQSNSAHRGEHPELEEADRCAQSVTDQVAQGIVSRALVDAVTLAESFHLNDGPGRHLTHFGICLTQDTS